VKLLSSKAILAIHTLSVCRKSLRGAELLRSVALQKFSLSSCVFMFQLNQLRINSWVCRCSSHDNSSKVIHILYRGYNHYVSLLDVVFELNNSDQASSDAGSDGLIINNENRPARKNINYSGEEIEKEHDLQCNNKRIKRKGRNSTEILSIPEPREEIGNKYELFDTDKRRKQRPASNTVKEMIVVDQNDQRQGNDEINVNMES
jgi:hypothetical protein